MSANLNELNAMLGASLVAKAGCLPISLPPAWNLPT